MQNKTVAESEVDLDRVMAELESLSDEQAKRIVSARRDREG
jgi:hypothetical protein